MASKQILRIGSRGSKLAVTQAEWLGGELKKKHPSLEIVYSRITTTGDKNLGTPLQALGGKGVFVKEIEEALLSKEIDLAVHSLKDVPQTLPYGLCLGPYPKREDPRDVVISRFGEQLQELPRGSIIGTSSPRRVAQIKRNHKKRQYHLEPLRGNVETRLNKVHDGQVDAAVMALAGLKRLGLEKEVTQILELDQMMPAPGQGCLALELRQEDKWILELLETIKDISSDQTARAERAFLQGVGGNCLAPLASVTKMSQDEIQMMALLLHTSGDPVVHVQESGPLDQVELVGAKLAGRLLYEGGADLLARLDQEASHESQTTR
jgi:hydroxymethylbilane synthase